MLKQDRIEDILVIAILTVADGRNFLSPQASVLPYGRVADGELNNTDLEVLNLLAKGCTVKEIIVYMGIASRTVYRVRCRLRDYLCVRTNDQIVDAAIRHGLVKSSSVIKSD